MDFEDDDFIAEVESVLAIQLFVIALWKDADKSISAVESLEMAFFEFADYHGDDLIADELIFLTEVNIERFLFNRG